MANTLTGLIPSLFKSLDVVSRELVGAIPCVTLDADVARAAVGQAVVSFVTPSATATDITPAVTPPNDGDQTMGNVSVSITKSRRVPFRWNGEEEKGLNNNGAGSAPIKGDQMTQAIRTLVNEMEADVVAAARKKVSRAYGTAGTTPFATNLAELAQARKILDDNGAPPSERSLIIDTTAGVNMRTLTQLTKVSEAGTAMTLRDGQLADLFGFSVHESAAVSAVTKGTGTGYLVNNGAGYAVGATDITVDTGAGTILAGDVITFTGDTNKYVVETTLAGGVVSISKPGLRQAVADNVAITVGNNFTPNLAIVKSSIVLATRLPALPKDGDMAADRITVIDPRTGLAFEVAMYPQYRQMQYEVSASWGTQGVKTAHGAMLLG